MESDDAVRRSFPVGGVLAVALLLFAVAAGAWVVWQLAAGSRPPQAFRERAALPRCPDLTVAQGEVAPDLADCLTGPAAERNGAEVLVSTLTDEGDPVRTYYRALPGGGAEVFVDATDDAYGPGGWDHRTCPDVVHCSGVTTVEP